MSCGAECSEMHTFDLGCDAYTGHSAPAGVGAELIRQGLEQVFLGMGLDPAGEALEGTPDRWLRALEEFTAGYREDPEKILGRTFEVSHSGEPIGVLNVPFVSMCEHHLLPFTGVATIAYCPHPGGRVVGLSKLPRLLDVYARRLQTQEQLTKQVTDALETYLRPVGSACVIGSEHGCLAHRGAKKPGALMVTSSFSGVYEHDLAARRSLFESVSHPYVSPPNPW